MLTRVRLLPTPGVHCGAKGLISLCGKTVSRLRRSVQLDRVNRGAQSTSRLAITTDLVVALFLLVEIRRNDSEHGP